MKINQLIKERNKKIHENGVLFILLIGGALLIDQQEGGIIFTVMSTLVKLSSLYGLILLSRRIREPIKCPCCNADIMSAIYSKSSNKIKRCPFCDMRFDQDSAPYKRQLAEIHKERGIVDEEFFDNA